MYRTHNCGELRETNAGQSVTIAGWLSNIRDKGPIIFITLRDFYGVTQAVATDEKIIKAIREIKKESTVQIKGKVILRSDPNPNMDTGMIEIEPESVAVLGRCTENLPFEVANSTESREDMRLKHRFLDLRNPVNKDKLILRSKIIFALRQKMMARGFYEMQTPILTSSSPEGARDYLVPSRIHPGMFYALPQAPQQFKQLLMASGFDRYFQIAPCFRDEDARADRSPGEFYQLDMEMAFAEQDDVFEVMEGVLGEVFDEFSTWEVDKAPFVRIKYNDAMETYGTDKPDLRNPLTVTDITHIFKDTEIKFMANKTVKAVFADSADKPRSFFDGITTKVVEAGAAGMSWCKLDANGELSGSITKLISPHEKEMLLAAGLKTGGCVCMVASEISGKDDLLKLRKLSGVLRTELGRGLELLEKDVFRFCWIVDFPMFELDEETNTIAFSHNPFSMPQGGMDALLNMDPLDIYAYQYDIVVNGTELSSGAVRNHSPEIMVKAFDIAGYSIDVIESKFPALFNAFKFGAPPHAGIAPGVDRMVMLLAGEPNIREVIAFPMNKNAQDLLMSAPNYVEENQLKELRIKLETEKPYPS